MHSVEIGLIPHDVKNMRVSLFGLKLYRLQFSFNHVFKPTLILVLDEIYELPYVGPREPVERLAK